MSRGYYHYASTTVIADVIKRQLEGERKRIADSLKRKNLSDVLRDSDLRVIREVEGTLHQISNAISHRIQQIDPAFSPETFERECGLSG